MRILLVHLLLVFLYTESKALASSGADGLFQTKTFKISGIEQLKRYQDKLRSSPSFDQWKINCERDDTCSWQKVVEDAQSLKSEEEKIKLIHRRIRRGIEYTKEDEGEENPQTALETMIIGKGDCEDFAILAFWLLEAAGLDKNKMYLVLVGDSPVKIDHAVLTIKLDNQFQIVDNRAPEVYSGNRDIGIRPAISMNKNGFWAHGYPKKK